MEEQFTSAQLYKVMNQSPDSACACPAQLCGSLIDLRELYDYQAACLRDTLADRKIHEAIALATTQAHTLLENCLKEILETEGWDLEAMALPAAVKKGVEPAR